MLVSFDDCDGTKLGSEVSEFPEQDRLECGQGKTSLKVLTALPS